ncbi:MAG: hypothetical protein M1822_000955 [Bathelium mastoideum]|nr:MAG: hypothetical protein M1822_000955 [Bathelium mastoideum]
MAEASTSQSDPPSGQQETEYIEATTDISDEGYDGSSDAGSDRSSMTSLSSTILNGVTENGRTYAAYGKEEYGMPSDELEMDRLDMAHAKYYMLLEKKRLLAPIGEDPHKVLDLGTGTGIWCIDIADQFPSANVLGVDIAPIQPSWVPPNCRFEIDDIEQEWTWPRASFDLIFSRDLLFAIRDWPKLVRQCYDHLRPGGWIEFQSIYGVLGCDDGTLPPDCNFCKFDRIIREAAVKNGTPLEAPDDWKRLFEEAGFEAVVERSFKIPSNPWAKDKRLKMVGMFEMENFLRGIEGMSLRLLQKGLGWDPLEATVFLANVKKDVRNLRYHMYYPL